MLQPVSDLAVYIHTPYCIHKCPYCDFATVGTEEVPSDPFLDALVTEIRSTRRRIREHELGEADWLAGRPATTIYFGGGTPSLLPASGIARVLEALDAELGIASDAEITLEANPGTRNARRFSGFREAGVNRLSIGVQSLDDEVLQTLGRVHDAAAARSAVEMAREAGFDNVSIDLIFAVPGMTPRSWEQGLDEALELRPEHVSAYNLTVEPATILAGWVKSGRIRLPEEDDQAEMYEFAVRRLAAAGFPRYEISNFAPRELRSRHNMAYWTWTDYLSFGPSAHSFLHRGDRGVRWWNDRNPQRYLDRAGDPALGGREVISGRRAMGEFAFTSLRTSDGLDVGRFEDVFGVGASDVYGEPLRRYQELGLLEESERGYALSERGFMLAETVFADFL